MGNYIDRNIKELIIITFSRKTCNCNFLLISRELRYAEKAIKSLLLHGLNMNISDEHSIKIIKVMRY